MTVHDWTCVDAHVFHHFHQRWTIAICDALNAGILPSGYSALVEQHAGGLIPDVLTLEHRLGADLAGEPAVGTLTTSVPKTSLVRRARAALAARANRIVIRHGLGEVVSIIEMVSPGNKSGRAALRAFVAKTIEFLRQGIHLLVIDILPPTARDPRGMHQAIWDEIDEQSGDLPVGKPLTLASYVAGDLLVGRETTAYVEFVGVGDGLPDMPAYLDPDGYVAVPLEASYQAAWATCPAALRELVEAGSGAEG